MGAVLVHCREAPEKKARELPLFAGVTAGAGLPVVYLDQRQEIRLRYRPKPRDPKRQAPLNSAIRKVQRHVNEKAHANQPSGTQDGENRVSRDGWGGVKWMESNTAAVGIVNRIGEQMIEVYQHCGEHDEPGSTPLFAEEEPGHGPGYNCVKNEMNNRRERHRTDFAHRFTAASAPGCWRGARLRRLMDDARNEIAVELSVALKRFQKLSA